VYSIYDDLCFGRFEAKEIGVQEIGLLELHNYYLVLSGLSTDVFPNKTNINTWLNTLINGAIDAQKELGEEHVKRWALSS